MVGCLDTFSEWFLSKCVEKNTSAEARRTAHPPGTLQTPTPPLNGTIEFERAPEPEAAEGSRQNGAWWARVAQNHASPAKPTLEFFNDYHTLPSGSKLWWQSMTPPLPRAVVVFFHGFEDHCDFHSFNVARAYAEHLNVASVLVDLPGHGRSDGISVLIRTWWSLIESVEHWIDRVAGDMARVSSAPGGRVPMFAYGGSMGGAVAITLAIRRPTLFSGVCLIAPMVSIQAAVRPHPAVEGFLRHVVCKIPVVQDMRLVKAKDIASLCFSKDAQWRYNEAMENDHLHARQDTRLRTGLSLLTATDFISCDMERFTTAFVVMHGAADQVTAPEQSQELHRRAGAGDKSIHLVPDAVHMLDHGETSERMEYVYRTLFAWLDQRIVRAALSMPQADMSANYPEGGDGGDDSAKQPLRTDQEV